MSEIHRQILPIPDVQRPGPMTYDAKDPDTSFPPIQPLMPPGQAPNVMLIMLDDVGFGAPSTFGGPCETPVFDRLAHNGLRYTRFHTTALCSPTRAALLSGRNHHSVGMGGVTEIATSAPGYNSMRPNTKAPLAEILKLNGYSTAQFGKCHEVPVEHTLPFLFSADETADVGVDTGTPVAPDYVSPDGAFTGDIHRVQVDTGPNDANHFIRPEDRIRIAMGRQ
ncbi:sulfatase-like hydrolase/transferase [Streptomyces sp. NPDC005485]|uniref:sulfatase-like hydrolase/transferase n=1 Tax=Streptomyces sp. NPDC005485 TaxID=3155591 RepID=UPI0033B070EB